METLIDAIRLSIASDASVEARTAGARACRTILAALEAKAGEPLAPTPVDAGRTGRVRMLDASSLHTHETAKATHAPPHFVAP